MKIVTPGENNFVPETGINKTENKIKDWTIEGIRDSDRNERLKIDKGKNIKSAKILTTNEMTTLHLLFGSNKPEEISFYGQNKVQPINKGQFVDIFG